MFLVPKLICKIEIYHCLKLWYILVLKLKK